MLDLKSLNTILFSNKESELKIAIKKIREQFEPEEAKNILSYAKVYNEILNVNSLDIELNKPIKVINDEEIINKFYDLEKDSPLFSFSSFARLVEIKKSISQAQINTVKKNYSKLEIKNKELANAKKANDTSKIQQLTNEIRKLQSYLDDTQAQVTLKILKHEITKEQYVKSFKLSKLIADYIEKNNTENNSLAYKHAYDMIACFGGKISQNQDIIANLQGFLSDKGFLNNPKPLHDTFAAFSFPLDKKNITLKKWQELIDKHGKEAMTLFAIADRIEAKKAQTTDIEKKNIAPKDLKYAIFLQTQLTYEKTKDYPDIAELALRYKLPEVHFNRALEVEKQKKKFDNLPDIVIHGKDIDFTLENGASLKGYHLVKLPINDPRAYILGHIVNDCQSIGGHSDRCVIDGISRENNGFYVLLKEKNSAKQNAKIFTSNGEIDYNHFDIVGQAYAWLSKAGNLTLDSWENLRKEDKITKVLNDDEVIVPILQEFGKQVCETTTINRVTVGVGGITPKKFVEFKIKFPEVMLEGQEYVDANNQSLIWQKPELTGLEDEINKYITKVEYKFELNNINKGKALLNLLKSEPKVEGAFSGAYKNQLCLLNFLVVNNDLKNFNYEYFKEFLDLDVITTTLLTSIKFLQGHKKGFLQLRT